MKACRIWLIPFVLTALFAALCLRVVSRQQDEITFVHAQIKVLQYDNAALTEGVQYLIRENQALGAELIERREKAHNFY